jgi:hypothetical protein
LETAKDLASCEESGSDRDSKALLIGSKWQLNTRGKAFTVLDYEIPSRSSELRPEDGIS